MTSMLNKGGLSRGRDATRVLCVAVLLVGCMSSQTGPTVTDLLSAFNGRNDDVPIPARLRDSQAQMDLIATAIDAAGYAPYH